MNRLVALSIFASLSVVLSACGGAERDVEGYNETAYELSESMEADRYYDWGNIDAFDARLQGDIGHLRGIDGQATVSGYAEESWADLEVTTVGPNGSAMHLLTFAGGINHPALVPGAHLEFNGDAAYDSEPNTLHVMSLNCSGAGQPGDWDYDEHADRVILDVSETDDENTIRVDYTTVKDGSMFSAGERDVSSGSFTLKR